MVLPVLGAESGRAERASARWSCSHATRGGDRAVPRSCSRVELVAEVDERRSSTEGVLVRRTLSSLTRRRHSRTWRTEAMGMRQRCRIRRGTRQGRQRSGRRPATRSNKPPAGGEARRSRRSGLRQERAPPHTWTPGAQAPGGALGPPLGAHVMVAAPAEAGGSPSSEAPPGWLIRHADRRGSQTCHRGSRPGWVGARGRDTPQGAARTGVPPGIERTAGCS